MRMFFIMKMMFLLMSLPMCLSAQIDFLEFINSIDWSSTENDFITKYSLQVKPCKHFYSNYYKTKTDYEIVGINLGNKEYTASIFVDSASLKLNSLFFTIENNQKNKNTLEDALKLSKEMDSLLVSLLGEPDKRMDELNNKYVNNLNRIWYKKNYLIEVLHMFSSDSHLYSLSVKGIENKSADFRVAKWGDSKKTVMEKEGKNNLSTVDNIYLFPDFVAGMNCNVAYIFTNDKLTMTKYIFQRTHSNNNNFINDFQELVNLMTEKYGEPDYNAPEWNNSLLYQDNSDNHGLAISLGHLSYTAGWYGETTKINVVLYGENQKIFLLIQYVSIKYEDLMKKANIQDKIKDL